MKDLVYVEDMKVSQLTADTADIKKHGLLDGKLPLVGLISSAFAALTYLNSTNVREIAKSLKRYVPNPTIVAAIIGAYVLMCGDTSEE